MEEILRKTRLEKESNKKAKWSFSGSIVEFKNYVDKMSKVQKTPR